MATVPEAFELARAHYVNGRFSEAEALLTQILRLQPTHAEALQWLSLVRSQGLLQQTSDRLQCLIACQEQRFLSDLLGEPRYADPLRLERFGFKCYSQNEEDGIVREIFRRIGTANRAFLEIGVQHGLENNTLFWLCQGWKGVWLEASQDHVNFIADKFREPIGAGSLRVRREFVTVDNINALISEFNLPRDLDLLSIDVDGNDYYLFEALTAVEPRLLVIEYNAKFPPPVRLVMRHNPSAVWRGTDYFGASLASLTALAERKGYQLVGCTVTGVNAFFVRGDLAPGHFQEPATAENFYHPSRFHLISGGFPVGHPADFGSYEVR